MPDSFLHKRNDFRALVATVADSKKINHAALVEKDYWIMHAVYGLKQLGLTFELNGGTSLSKGFGIIQRFSLKTRRSASNLKPSIQRLHRSTIAARFLWTKSSPAFSTTSLVFRLQRI